MFCAASVGELSSLGDAHRGTGSVIVAGGDASAPSVDARDVRGDDGLMKSGTMFVVLACAAVTGCSLQDLLKKADDAGAGATGAGSVTSASAVADPAPLAAAVNDAGPVAKNGPSGAATAKAKSAVPACSKGKVLGTEALSPFKPVCGAPCKTDADCTGVACTDVNALAPDGTIAKSGPPFIKICDPDIVVEKTAPGSKPTPSASASASASAASAKKKDDCGCGAGQVLFTSADTVTCAVLPCRSPGGSCKKEDKTVGTCIELGTGEAGQRVRCGHLIQCQ